MARTSSAGSCTSTRPPRRWNGPKSRRSFASTSRIDEIVEAAGFIGLNDEQKTALQEQFDTSSAVE